MSEQPTKTEADELADHRAAVRLMKAAPYLLAACENYYFGRKDARECEREMRDAIRMARISPEREAALTANLEAMAEDLGRIEEKARGK